MFFRKIDFTIFKCKRESCLPFRILHLKQFFSGMHLLLYIDKHQIEGFPGDLVVNNPPAKQETQVQSLGWKDPPLPPQRRKWQPTLVFLPGESYGQRSLVGYSPWGRKESGTTERLTLT